MLSSSGSFITKLINMFHVSVFVLENDNKTISNIDGNIKQRR